MINAYSTPEAALGDRQSRKRLLAIGWYCIDVKKPKKFCHV